MVKDDRYCIDILTQISAAQAALDKVALGLLDGHAHTCVIGAEPDQQDERTEEMMAAVGGSSDAADERGLTRSAVAALSTNPSTVCQLRGSDPDTGPQGTCACVGARIWHRA